MCGDSIHVYLVIDEDGIVQDAAFDGQGCAISTASASMMTEIVRGKSEAEAKELFESFHAMVMGDGDPPEGDDFDRLQVLAGIRQFPMRVKCATLAWHTLNAAIKGEAEISSE